MPHLMSLVVEPIDPSPVGAHARPEHSRRGCAPSFSTTPTNGNEPPVNFRLPVTGRRDSRPPRAAPRHAVALAASVLAHAALLAAVIWSFPSPPARPTQWVLAYFIELAPAGSQGARGRSADATAAAPQPPIATRPPHAYKRTRAPLPKVRLISPRVAGSAADSVPDQADAALASVTTAGTGIGRASDGGAIGDGAGASRFGHGASERDGDGIEVASADYAHNPLPRYPDYARRHEQQGAVTLRVLVAADGAVRAVEIAESSGFDSLDAAALAAVRDRWRFTPARRATGPVESWVLVPIRFALKDRHASR